MIYGKVIDKKPCLIIGDKTIPIKEYVRQEFQFNDLLEDLNKSNANTNPSNKRSVKHEHKWL